MLDTAKLTTGEELAEHMSRVSAAKSFRIYEPARQFTCTTNHALSKGVVVVKQSISAEANMASEAARDAFVFHLTLSGQSRLRAESGEFLQTTGSGNVITTREPIDLLSSPSALRLGVLADRTALASTLDRHFGLRCKSELKFEPSFNTENQNGLFLRSMADAYLLGASMDPHPERAVEALGDSILMLLLEAFPNSCTDLIQKAPTSLPPRHVRRAISIMEDHAGTDISVVGIADLVGVTTRALQYAFLRHLGVTPVRYMHDIRLRRAVRDLVMRTDMSANDIAAAWGFSNFGRFSAACVRAYGKRPSDIRKDKSLR